MKTAIQQRAAELGFDDCRFTTASAPDHAAQFQDWLASGAHGQMEYLQRNAHKRVDPSQVLAGAKTIVTLLVSYAKPLTADTATAGSTGQIARYARFRDYHDVLGERLKMLASFVSSLAPGTRSLWYVDTGPLLERDLAGRAGLGFVGKHTNLISRRFGNWIFLSRSLPRWNWSRMRRKKTVAAPAAVASTPARPRPSQPRSNSMPAGAFPI